MKRSTIIATCLHNSGMVSSLQDGESAVRSVFCDEFPEEDFGMWNREVLEQVAEKIISTVGRASTIRVDRFIDDLRDC